MGQPNSKTRFVLLTSPRTGSTWLVSLLQQMENTTAYGELFLPRARRDDKYRWNQEFDYPRFVEVKSPRMPLRPLHVFSYLNTLYRNPGVVGFKLMYSHLNRFPELLMYFLLLRVRAIHLVRENCLDLLISQAMNRRYHRPHRHVGQEEPGQVQIELDPETIIQKIESKQKKVEQTRRLLKKSRLPVLEIAYEDLRTTPDTFLAICQFLSIPSPNEIPSSKFVKVRRASQAQTIRNYEDIRNVLIQTPFRRFLEEESQQV